MDTLLNYSEIELLEKYVFQSFKKNGIENYMWDDSMKVEVKGDSIITNTDKVRYDMTGMRLNIMNDFNIGEWLVVSNISDLISSGGIPKYIMLNLSFPKDFFLNKFLDILNGISSACLKYNIQIIGGDLSTSKEVGLVATAIGELHGIQYVRRDNSKVGDLLFTEASPGLTSTCLYYHYSAKEKGMTLSNNELKELNSSFTTHDLRIDASKIISNSNYNMSCIDNSDGFGHTLLELSKRNNCGMHIKKEKLKIHEISHKVAEFLQKKVEEIICGPGADHKLIGVVSKEDDQTINKLKSINFNMIGELESQTDILIDGIPQPKTLLSGWNHFGNWKTKYK